MLVMALVFLLVWVLLTDSKVMFGQENKYRYETIFFQQETAAPA